MIYKKYQQTAITNEYDERFDIEYTLGKKAITEIESLSGKIVELEQILSELEKIVGFWDKGQLKQTVSSCISHLFKFSASQASEEYVSKVESLRKFGKTIDNFIETRKESIEKGSKFVKIKELNDILEIYENFEGVIGNLKKRFKVIKEIYSEVDQFESMINELVKKVVSNKSRMSELKELYEGTLDELQNYYEVIAEVETLDKEFKHLLV